MADLVAANGRTVDAPGFRRALIAWGQSHYRSFPWRLTNDPYRILMAEIMLHRTQARQVAPVYEHFLERYPQVSVLAQATREELNKVLYSLGLRWRIDLIAQMSVQLMERFGGRVPEGKADLLSLPGLNQYIAGAVRCFAWNRSEPLVDTNTVRVAGRLFGLEIKDSSRRNRRFQELIAALVDPDEPRVYSYALLDLAEQVCMKRRAPRCGGCPVSGWCGFAEQLANEGD